MESGGLAPYFPVVLDTPSGLHSSSSARVEHGLWGPMACAQMPALARGEGPTTSLCFDFLICQKGLMTAVAASTDHYRECLDLPQSHVRTQWPFLIITAKLRCHVGSEPCPASVISKIHRRNRDPKSLRN